MLLTDYFFYFIFGQLKSVSAYHLSFIFLISSSIDGVKVEQKPVTQWHVFPRVTWKDASPAPAAEGGRWLLWTGPQDVRFQV